MVPPGGVALSLSLTHTLSLSVCLSLSLSNTHSLSLCLSLYLSLSHTHLAEIDHGGAEFLHVRTCGHDYHRPGTNWDTTTPCPVQTGTRQRNQEDLAEIDHGGPQLLHVEERVFGPGEHRVALAKVNLRHF